MGARSKPSNKNVRMQLVNHGGATSKIGENKRNRLQE